VTGAVDWQTRVGDVWAAEWRRTDRSFAELAPHLDAAILAAAPPGPAEVLDIGCGAGATSGALAVVRPDLAITGVDLSSALVAIARDRVPTARFRVADVTQEPLDRAPELLVSRHGVMFFADPVAAFTRLRRIAAPDAGLVFSCFGRRALNAFAHDLVTAVAGEEPADPPGYAPGPFGFADPLLVAHILTTAGWTAAAPRAVDFGYVAGEGADPVADATDFLTRIGPLARTIADADDSAVAVARLTAALARYRRGARVVLPASAWIWQARATAAGEQS
jgi:SAM-dependent methyltransferase